MSFYSIAPFIREFYPEYYSIETYPKDKCVTIRKVEEPWGILGNFGRTPIIYKDVTFKNSEQLFQLMKFTDPEIIKRIWNGITANDKICHEVKRTVKSYEKAYRRPDWGSMILDALKFALMRKYEQCELFRTELERSRGRFIVEDQTTFPKAQPDCWGVKPAVDGVNFSGPNVLGRLLMELRDRGQLEYRLPDDALDYIKILKKVPKFAGI